MSMPLQGQITASGWKRRKNLWIHTGIYSFQNLGFRWRICGCGHDKHGLQKFLSAFECGVWTYKSKSVLDI